MGKAAKPHVSWVCCPQEQQHYVARRNSLWAGQPTSLAAVRCGQGSQAPRHLGPRPARTQGLGRSPPFAVGKGAEPHGLPSRKSSSSSSSSSSSTMSLAAVLCGQSTGASRQPGPRPATPAAPRRSPPFAVVQAAKATFRFAFRRQKQQHYAARSPLFAVGRSPSFLLSPIPGNQVSLNAMLS